MEKHTRHIKIQYQYRNRRRQPSGHVPWLPLSGVWLEALGFHIGERVRIIARERLLIIEPLEGAEAELEIYKEELREVKRTLKELVQ